MTPKVVVVGQEAKGDGVVEVFDFSASGLASVSKVSSPTAIKCVRPGLSPRTIVTGGFTGSLSVWCVFDGVVNDGFNSWRFNDEALDGI